MTSHVRQYASLRMVPHARTLRKARMQVQLMVNTGFSAHRIRRYLHRFVLWWTNTTEVWHYCELISWFCKACFDEAPAAIAAGLLLKPIKGLNSLTVQKMGLLGDDLAVAVAAGRL